MHETQPKAAVFLTLLRIYLVPRPPSTTLLVAPALALVGRHSTKLDARDVLPLLPPLLAVADVEAFVRRSLVKGASERSQARVVAHVAKSRLDALDWKLLRLQDRRVRIAETRLCVGPPSALVPAALSKLTVVRLPFSPAAARSARSASATRSSRSTRRTARSRISTSVPSSFPCSRARTRTRHPLLTQTTAPLAAPAPVSVQGRLLCDAARARAPV